MSISYEWNEIAFEEASRLDKPIFVWIKDEGSYWCDVMKKESLGDPYIQKKLENRFVTIIVDANDRADIAKYYQKLHTQMRDKEVNYPLSIFLSADKTPLYISSFVPAKSSDGMMAFADMLDLIADTYEKNPDSLTSKGKIALEAIDRSKSNIEATKIDKSIVTIVKKQIKELSDTVNGGFDNKPKFPRHSILSMLLDILNRDDDESIACQLVLTLDKMIDGQLLDKLDNGFHHYCTDESWQNAYHGKSLKNNAQLVSLLTRAYQKTTNERYKEQALKTLDFIQNKLSDGSLYYLLYDDGLVDDRLVLADNAMAISAMIDVASIEERYLYQAKDAIAAVLSRFMKNGRLYHSIQDGKLHENEAYLDDYAHFGITLLKAYQSTGDDQYAIQASEIINEAIKKYFNQGLWKYSDTEMSTLCSTDDKDAPSEISTMVLLLKSASKFINPQYEKFASRTIVLHSYQLMRQPMSMPELARVVMSNF